ncbi:Adrenodoxin-like protein 1 mitochondrial [Taenia crassiceps]|uniref:Adrenodoxin-like protein 1 mitochondrial n=1 Tax=Taenia crassiceps TaxID=6207 RepID=A0ABR4PZA1_9CEST
MIMVTGVRFNGRYEWEESESPHDVAKNGTEIRVAGKVNDNLMYLARRHGIEIEGACEASLACSTCHVYVDEGMFDKLPEPKDEENDMLDLAPFLKPNSRLSCQIILTKELDGIVIELPPATRNFYLMLQGDGGQLGASRIWEDILSAELEHIRSSGDPFGLLKSVGTPVEYYLRLKKYAAGKHASQALKNLYNFVSDLESGLIECKDSEKARKLRESGNRYFKSEDYDTASEYYRKGILIAEKDSKELALLHGNLSACLQHQSKWTACIWHVCLALRIHSDPQSQIGKRLQLRLKQACAKNGRKALPNVNECYEWVAKLCEGPAPLQNSEERYGFVNLPIPKYGRSEKLKALSSRLAVHESSKQGRYVVCEGNFEAGDVLASEPAGGWEKSDVSCGTPSTDEMAVACCILLPYQRHNRCFACHNQLESVGHVCPHCNDAAFCGPPSCCFSQHFKNGQFIVPLWHKDECKYIFLLNSIGLGHLCYRLGTLRGRRLLRTDREASLDSLVDNYQHFPSHFEYGLTGWLCGLLMGRIGLTNCGDWCFRMLHRLQCNAHAITQINTIVSRNHKLVDMIQERVGGGLFPTASFINHACEPNIAYQFTNGFIIIRCIKDLSPGDEILACYGPHFRHEPDIGARKRALIEQYFFECSCVHCDETQKASVLSPEDNDRWRELVKQIRSPKTPLSALPSLFKQLKHLSNPTIAMTPKPSYGEIADEIAFGLFEEAVTTSSLEARKLALYLTTTSCDFVRARFGADSIEYAWELLKLMSVARAAGDMLTSGFGFIPAFLRRASPTSIDILKPVVIGCYRMYPGDELGRGVTKGGGKGGVVRDAGGSFGKREAALEEEYFHRKDLEQLKELKKHLVEEVKFHEEQIERHKAAVERYRKSLESIE